MKVKTFSQSKKYTGNFLMDRTVIVVDVLRATTCIIWACRNGANRIIPVSDAGEGAAIASRLGDCIMAGERGGIKLPGFDLGNSPLEFSPCGYPSIGFRFGFLIGGKPGIASKAHVLKFA